MLNAIVKDFNCETLEGYDRYAEVNINCRILLTETGIFIDEVKQVKIREAIKRAVIEAITVEGHERKEASK